MAAHHGQGARRATTALVRPDDGEPGRPGPDDDGGTGQAPLRSPRGDLLRRQLRRVVRRGGKAGVRRHDPPAFQRQAHRLHQAAGRSGGLHHSLELPQRDARAQDRTGPRGRLHGGLQAGQRDAPVSPCTGRAGDASGHPGRSDQHPLRQDRGDRRGTHVQPHRPQAHLHGLHRGGQAAHGSMRGHDEADVHGTGRQRALHRVRRRRPGGGGRRRHDLQVPQRGPDLRVRQPHPRPGRRLRRVRGETRRGRGRDQDGRRHRGGRHRGSADQHRGRGQRDQSRYRRGGPGRHGRDRRGSVGSGRVLRPTHHPHQRDRRHAGLPRRDLRTHRAADEVQHRRGSDRHGQRHRVRPGQLLLHPRRRPHLARQRGAGVRHRRDQRGHHLQRNGPLRRRQGIRPGPRGVQVRTRRLPGDQVHVHRGDRGVAEWPFSLG